MPLVAAAVCPHPPLLVPEVASGAATELDDLRVACAEAVNWLIFCGARSVTVVGSGPPGDLDAGRYDGTGEDGTGEDGTGEDGTLVGSLTGFGVPLRVSLPSARLVPPGSPPASPLASPSVRLRRPLPQRAPSLPVSLTVAAWLLRGIDLPVRMQYVPPATPTSACAGWSLPEPAARPWGLLVMGDGSARRGPKAPGFDDPRAEPFDEQVAAALGSADLDALMAIDAALAADLLCAGRAAWQVLAGVAARLQHATVAGRSPSVGWRGELSYYAAPYGVAYFVATWAPAWATGDGARIGRTSVAGGGLTRER